MPETIKSPYTGKQLDKYLRDILDLLRLAKKTENNGKVVYIRRGKWAFESGESLFNLTELS